MILVHHLRAVMITVLQLKIRTSLLNVDCSPFSNHLVLVNLTISRNDSMKQGANPKTFSTFRVTPALLVTGHLAVGLTFLL